MYDAVVYGGSERPHRSELPNMAAYANRPVQVEMATLEECVRGYLQDDSVDYEDAEEEIPLPLPTGDPRLEEIKAKPNGSMTREDYSYVIQKISEAEFYEHDRPGGYPGHEQSTAVNWENPVNTPYDDDIERQDYRNRDDIPHITRNGNMTYHMAIAEESTVRFLLQKKRLPHRRRFYTPMNWHSTFPGAIRMASYLTDARYLRSDEKLYFVVIRLYNRRYYDNEMVIFSRRNIEDSYYTIEESGMKLTPAERSTTMIYRLTQAYYDAPSYKATYNLTSHGGYLWVYGVHVPIAYLMTLANLNLWAEVISQSEKNYDYFWSYIADDIEKRYPGFNIFYYVFSYEGMKDSMEWIFYHFYKQTDPTIRKDYKYADVAVKEALSYGPDNVPTNLRLYTKSGCRSLPQIIDMLAADYDWAKGDVAYPERQYA